jgi:hypothetical protein
LDGLPLAEITRERQLLLCCARTQLDTPTRQRIGALLSGSLDWDRFLQMAQAHQVMPLVASILGTAFAAKCPPTVTERVRGALRVEALRGLLAAQRLAVVVDLFGAADVPVIPFKGPTLSILAYGHLGLRQFGDLDVWVHPWDYHLTVPGLLARHGWSQVSDYGFERGYRDAGGDTVLDVHRSLTYSRSMPVSLRFEDALTRCREVSVCGRSAKTLAPADLLLALCVQLAKDTAEERRGPPLAKVCDIAELLRNQPTLDWNGLVQEARGVGVLKVVCLGLAVAAQLLEAPMPARIGRECGRFAELDSLVRHVEERIFHDEVQTYSRPALLDASAWNAAIRERFRDRNRAAVALTQFVFAPNEYDYAFVRLPKRMAPLYRIVRPIRLGIKRARALVGGRLRNGA